jgi:UDP-N-acetyl-2-amino-2-deoxyglucuronate dehydrogenase
VNRSQNFALVGAAGYIAPRHMKAIRDTGHKLVAAVDPHDSVGVLDRYALDVRYFREVERFDRHLEKLRRGPAEQRIDYVTVCSPNYLHDAHCRLALRVGAHVICEKPVVINPWNLDALEAIEAETGRTISTVLQLRLHPALLDLKARLLESGGGHEVELTYVTARGPWYHTSWKGSEEKSGGVIVNIGIHLFDMLVWLFGACESTAIQCVEPQRASGVMVLNRAEVRWFLSVSADDLPAGARANGCTTHRSIKIDGSEVEFTDGFEDLHTRSYEEILAGRGFGLKEARASIELVHRIRHTPPSAPGAPAHPLALARERRG